MRMQIELSLTIVDYSYYTVSSWDHANYTTIAQYHILIIETEHFEHIFFSK